MLTALATETRGRLRALVADVAGERTTVVGVLSWVLLADGWRVPAARTEDGDAHRVEVAGSTRRTWPPSWRPVLAEVTA